MAEPKNPKLAVLKGGLNIAKRLLKDDEAEAIKAVTAAQRAEAGRKAAELIKSQPQVKASEALGQLMEKGFKRTTTTQADRTRVGGGNIGGAPFSALSEADPNYAGKVWGVMDEGTASRLKNLTTPDTAWTTMLGSADQLKTNPIVFDKLKRQFIDAMKQGKLSPELEAKINHNLALSFGEGAQIRDPQIWKQADTFEKRAALADLMMGQGIPPKKGGVALGGEKSGKGVIFKPTDTLKRETEPSLLHTEHGGDTPTFAAGPRLFTLENESVYRPDLHPGFPTLLTGKDLEVNMIPTPTEVYLPDWHKDFKKKKPERFQGPWAQDIIERRKNKEYKLKGAEGPGYYDLALGLKGEGLPSQDLNDEYIRHLLREGFKKGGAVSIDEADARLAKAIENRMAKGGAVDLDAADARLSDAIAKRTGMAEGGEAGFKKIQFMNKGGKLAKGIAQVGKRLMADDVLPAAEREANLAKFLDTSHEKRRLYHATPSDFKEFQGKGFDPTISGNATWLTPNKEKQPAAHNTSSRTQVYREGVNVMPVHVKAERPLVLDDRNMEDWAKAVYANDSAEFPFLIAPDWLKKIKEDGYDSIFHPRSGEVIMLEPNKIKSAIGNRGTYNIEEADITKADGGKMVKGAAKVFKRIFKDDVLPAPEREANLQNFLAPSKAPMRLYHGTTATEGGKGTEAIRRIKSSKDGALGSGVYMTPNTNYADQYTYKGAGNYEGGNTLPVYAQIKNPLVIDGSASNDPMVEALIRLGMDEAQASRMVERAYENKGYIGKEVESRARAAGYDGLMQYGKDGELGEVVSYNPSAVKSAIGNRGTYDLNEPDLSKADGGTVFKKLTFMADGGVLHMGGGGKLKALGKIGKRLLADPDAATPSISSGTRKFGDDAGGLNIIKETGGNWSPSGSDVYKSNLDRQLEKLDKGRYDLSSKYIKQMLEDATLRGDASLVATLTRDLRDAIRNEAASKWVQSNLKNYITKQMATKDDPVRKLAEEGITAFPKNIDEYGDLNLRDYGSAEARVNRQVTGNEPKGVAKSPLAKHYETMTDESINPTPAKEYQRIQALPKMQRPTFTIDAPWMSKLDPETPIFSLSRDADFDKLGFGHMIDVLREDVAAGRIRPEKLNTISIEQAVRRTHEYDETLKANMLNARIAEQANANVFKEYPEGYRWVQLDKPGQFALESDIMGHSVRGYEPPKGHPDYTDISGDSGHSGYGHGGYDAIKSGRAKVYSLRDPKGQSHVTVEVGTGYDAPSFYEANKKLLEDPRFKQDAEMWNNYADTSETYVNEITKLFKEAGLKEGKDYSIPVEPKPRITQIKGKQNAAPNEEYLPFVQDFVKSGDWSEVDDFKNTGFVRIDPSSDLAANLKTLSKDVPKYVSQDELTNLLKWHRGEGDLPSGFSQGGGAFKKLTFMAQGGGAFKKLQFMGGGGITTSGGSFSPEELGVNPSDLVADEKLSKKLKRGIAREMDIGKEQLEQEYRQLGNKGGKKDAAIRIGSQFLGSGSDLLNLGLEGLDLIQGVIPALSKPESVLDVTGDRVPKFKLASDKPFLGSQQFIDKFKEAKLLGENEFPLTELVAGFAAPAAAVGALRKGKQAYKGAKALMDKPKKRHGGLTAMAR